VVVVVTAGGGAGASCATGTGATVVVVVVDVVGGAVDELVDEVGASVPGVLEVAWNRAGIDAEAERGRGAGVRPKSTTSTAMSTQLVTRRIGISPAARARRAGGKGIGEGSRVWGVRAVAHIYPFRFSQTAKLHRRGK
jgi:hypothetical protein